MLRICLLISGIALSGQALVQLWSLLLLVDRCYVHFWSRITGSGSLEWIPEITTVDGDSVSTWTVIVGHLIKSLLLGGVGLVFIIAAIRTGESSADKPPEAPSRKDLPHQE